MAKSEKSTEVISILEVTNYKSIPAATRKVIEDLSKELKVETLNKFNPIVESLAQIENYKKLKYKDDENVIQLYKDAVKFIGSFNSSTKKSKKELKAPYLETGRKIDAIEKAFLESAGKVKNHLLKEFKPYIDEQARLKKEKEDRKNAKAIEKMSNLTEENEGQQLVIRRLQLMEGFRKNINNILTNATENILKYSKEAIEEQQDLLLDHELVFTDSDKEVLLPEQIVELEALSNDVSQSAMTVYQKQLEVLNAPNLNVVDHTIVAPSLQEENPDYFENNIYHIIDEAIQKVENLNPADDKERAIQLKLVKGFTAYKGLIKQEFNK